MVAYACYPSNSRGWGQENCLNLGDWGCSEPRLCHCTTAWVTDWDSVSRGGGEEGYSEVPAQLWQQVFHQPDISSSLEAQRASNAYRRRESGRLYPHCQSREFLGNSSQPYLGSIWPEWKRLLSGWYCGLLSRPHFHPFYSLGRNLSGWRLQLRFPDLLRARVLDWIGLC